ncbi:hypothetical protein F9U64_09460 [Gracilibacillus oryzae]|uniref:Dimethylamine monooxygenase subunit DmmA-like C-terminal domain-containing protein n=1 Tax=Gracilibacillus oryzae TaxID=1672701 RepID=A0A7C8KSQ1_9BACI|nr:dimethylamine monooxygenase subunit DmmA family protein [Gracilibacillus oryzae]KAB8137456.1 hypothetical protein F9U64_09460 [Gracilibacillus oryzae]
MPTMAQTADHKIELPAYANKIMLILDERGMKELSFSELDKTAAIIEVYLLMEANTTIPNDEVSYDKLEVIRSLVIPDLLFDQRIGTYVILGCEAGMANSLKKQAEQAGFSDQEIRVLSVGEVEAKLFCVKCYHYNSINSQDTVLCKHCQTKLDVSTHFSRVRDAYLGYVAI